MSIGISFDANYDRLAVIAALKEHLAAHKVDYALALEAYTAKKTKLLREFNRAFKKDPKASLSEVYSMIAPVDTAKSYEATIKAFEMATGETIELSSEAADAVFNDTWSWANNAKVSNSYYRTHS